MSNSKQAEELRKVMQELWDKEQQVLIWCKVDIIFAAVGMAVLLLVILSGLYNS